MARRPNYRFERVERDRAKAAKRAAKREAKAAKKLEKDDGNVDAAPSDSDAPADQQPEVGKQDG